MKYIFLFFYLSLFCSSAFAAGSREVRVSTIPIDIRPETCTIGIDPICFIGLSEYASEDEFNRYIQRCSISKNDDILIGMTIGSSLTNKNFQISGIITKEEFDEIKKLRWDKILLIPDNNMVKYKKYKLFIDKNSIISATIKYINYEDIIN